jgi:hypothetical protein
MAKFRIDESKIAPSGSGSLFRVTWLGEALEAGEWFEVYEVGHWWRIPATTIMPATGGAVLGTTFTIGWESQYVGAVIDTEAQDYR